MTTPLLAVYAHDEYETRGQAHARIEADVAAGLRCPRCHLTLPCGGHAFLELRRSSDHVQNGRKQRTRNALDRIRDNQRNRRLKVKRAAEGRSR